MEATRWPIDYEAIKKGDSIPVDKVERLVGVSRTDARFSLLAMQMAKQIERDLHINKKMWTVRTEGGSIRVLTDAEASHYNHSRQRRDRRSMFRRFALNSAVDATLLSDDQKQQHDRAMEVDGRYIQAMRSTRAQLSAETYRRNTPTMLPAPETTEQTNA